MRNKLLLLLTPFRDDVRVRDPESPGTRVAPPPSISARSSWCATGAALQEGRISGRRRAPSRGDHESTENAMAVSSLNGRLPWGCRREVKPGQGDKADNVAHGMPSWICETQMPLREPRAWSAKHFGPDDSQRAHSPSVLPSSPTGMSRKAPCHSRRKSELRISLQRTVQPAPAHAPNTSTHSSSSSANRTLEPS